MFKIHNFWREDQQDLIPNKHRQFETTQCKSHEINKWGRWEKNKFRTMFSHLFFVSTISFLQDLIWLGRCHQEELQVRYKLGGTSQHKQCCLLGHSHNGRSNQENKNHSRLVQMIPWASQWRGRQPHWSWCWPLWWIWCKAN